MTDRPRVKELIEQTKPTQGVKYLCEEKVTTPGGKIFTLMKVGGTFGWADEPTGNRRRYTREVLSEGLKGLRSLIDSRQCLGELDHPDDGRTRLQRVSHLITKVELRENGEVYGEALILNTEQGKNLRALFEADVMVGCSSRGFGETEMAEDGFENVKAGYQLKSYDFVFEPASARAFPKPLGEAKEYPRIFESMEGDPIFHLAEEMTKKYQAGQKVVETTEATPLLPVPLTKKLPVAPVLPSVAPVVAPAPAVVFTAQQVQEQIEVAIKTREAAWREAALKAEAEKIAAIKASVMEEVRSQMTSDPQIVGAAALLREIGPALWSFIGPKDVVEARAQFQVELAQSEAKWKEEATILSTRLQEAEAENTNLINVAREAGYRLYLETVLHGSPDRGLYNHMLGDLDQYESLDQLKEQVSFIESEITKAREEELRKLTEQENQRQALLTQQEKILRQREEELLAMRQKLQEKDELLNQARTALSEQSRTGVVATRSAQTAKLESKQADLNLYLERRINASADPTRSRTLASGRVFTTQDQIDQVIEESDNATAALREPQSLGARLSNSLASRRGVGSSALLEENTNRHQAPRINPPQDISPGELEELGLNDLDEMNRKSGRNLM